MPYQIEQILQGKGAPVSIDKDDLVSKALTIMIEHDFSQLPVTSSTDPDYAYYPIGMITYEGILRGIRNFKARIDDLRVRDVMVPAPMYQTDDDLFDILDRLQDTNAVLVMHNQVPALEGIVTSYDMMAYFRSRTEDLMRVEDIELMIKDFIRAGYTKENGEIDEGKLTKSIERVTVNPKQENGRGEKVKTFDQLTLADYIAILLMTDTWSFYESIFGVQRDFIRELLSGVREIRNALAHFRGDLTSDQRDRLKFATEWLSRRQEDYQAQKAEGERQKALELFKKQKIIEEVQTPKEPVSSDLDEREVFTSRKGTEKPSGQSVMEPYRGSGGRYKALIDWLQTQPAKINQIQMTFDQIEEIIGSELPYSARNYRAWWANDSVGHSHSQQWLEAGWRTSYVNLNKGTVTFNRIQDRARAYIVFFSKFLDELRQKATFGVKDISPNGASWIIVNDVGDPQDLYHGSFGLSFTKDKRLRVELYLDLNDKELNKSAFDILFAQKDKFATQLPGLEWERLDNRRASRIAIYHGGQVTDIKNHEALRQWAVNTMIAFYNVLREEAAHACLLAALHAKVE